MNIKVEIKKELSWQETLKMAYELKANNPLAETIFIDQPDISDLFVVEGNKLRKCTDNEWARYFKSNF